MDYKVVYTKLSQKDLRGLDRSVVQRILKKVDEFSQLDEPLVKAKKLKGFEIDTYRFRVGNYRVVFRLDPKSQKLVILVVLRVAHRKDIYDKNV
ncbi:type II toxin-antitoxin system RelE/ParE family toxin [Candidatus Peregrinibacteria bacterium]|jgi:mRNA interferase RelE/StbE|nr:type II toxin-antitoxin system RelE/ParE family toxin [Candidatus Peregrinibacteria bacterium]MBT4632265.1 type II toxin-antitoxin system RelE/ParE family toxin [Candidatus Peregrinibacteria bacterium]MBT5824324.1 type II toxin-antitoxin system RelE/ParE family toxin [Candidatus Peregrinibacteria bacterium]